MAKEKGKAAPHHTDEEKISLSKRICEIYETQHCTLDSACEAVGITSRSFYLWAAQISEISETYKKAKVKSEEHYFEERLKPKVMRSLEKLVEGQTYTETRREEGSGPQGPTFKTVETDVTVLPNPTSVIFAMKGIFKDRFAELSKTETTLTVVNGGDIDPKDFALLKQIAEKE